jgi:dCMP deaminase
VLDNSFEQSKTNFFDHLRSNRPDWDTYFLLMAELVSTRSIDQSRKHGCVIVDSQKRVLSVGYNGAIQGVDDSLIPQTRPEKYFFMIHAEENALLFCKSETQGATVYITGRPCAACLRKLIQKSIARVVYRPQVSRLIDAQDLKAQELMIKMSGIELIEYI